jgi:hypothetical protein
VVNIEKNNYLKSLSDRLEALVLCDAWMNDFGNYIFIDDMDKDALKKLYLALERIKPLLKYSEGEHTSMLDRALIKLNFMMS